MVVWAGAVVATSGVGGWFVADPTGKDGEREFWIGV
jgi:hypothetical protein